MIQKNCINKVQTTYLIPRIYIRVQNTNKLIN